MQSKLEEFLDSLIHHLEQHEIKATVTSMSGNVADVGLHDEEGEEFYVGNYADPGLKVEWLGGYYLSADALDVTTDLVRVNGIVFSALGRHVAGWIVGYD